MSTDANTDNSKTLLVDLPTPPGYNTIREASATVLVPVGNHVFYNEVQEFNRDLSILVISQFSINLMKKHEEAALEYITRQESKKNDDKDNKDTKKSNVDVVKESEEKEQPPVKKSKPSPPSAPQGSPDIVIPSHSSDKTTDQDFVKLDSSSSTETTTTTTDNNVIATEDVKKPYIIEPTAIKPLNQFLCTKEDQIPARLHYPGVRIFEAFAATGLRSIRYYNEIPLVHSLHVNDLDPEAVESIHRNALYNQVDMKSFIPTRNEATAALYANRANVRTLLSKMKMDSTKTSQMITPTVTKLPDTMSKDDPRAFLYEAQNHHVKSLCPDYLSDIHPWNVIDLDPYGSASPFLDASIQAIEDNGLLCITCTDSAILCGNYPETGFGKYNSIPLHTSTSKEYGLRMLLHTIESTATKYGRTITPLLSLAVDFYVRVFVTVRTSPAAVKFSGTNHCMIGQCTHCQTTYSEPMMVANPPLDPSKPMHLQAKTKHSVGSQLFDSSCTYCNSRIWLGGPLWSGPIHDEKFVSQLLESLDARQEYTTWLQNTTNSSSSATLEKLSAPVTIHKYLPFKTYKRILAILTMVRSEIPTLLYANLAQMSRALCIATPRIEMFLSAITNAGYRSSESHCEPSVIKTDAPYALLWDILKALLVLNNGTPGKSFLTSAHCTRSFIANNKITDPDGKLLQIDDAKDLDDEKNNINHNRTNENIKINNNDVFIKEFPVDAYASTKLRYDAFMKEFLAAPALEDKKNNQKQLLAWWMLSTPIQHDISFVKHQRNKIIMFFSNPEAHWGPKAMAGGFEIRGYGEILGNKDDDSLTQTKNISRALANAQHQRSLDNQAKNLEKKKLQKALKKLEYEQKYNASKDVEMVSDDTAK